MTKLSALALILSGVDPGPPLIAECRFVQIRNLNSAGEALLLRQRPTAGRAFPIQYGDVLLPARGERTTAVEAPPHFLGAYATLDIYLVRPDRNRLDPAYLVAFLSLPSTGTHLRRSTAGASLPRIPKEAVGNLQIPLPTLDQQREIGGLCSSIIRRRELASQLAAAESHFAERSLERAFVALT